MTPDPTLNARGDAASRVAGLNADLRNASAQVVIRAARREFGDGLCYVSSFGAESAVMLALIADVDPGVRIIFIDTGMHFQQTLDYRDTLTSALGLTNLRTVRYDEAERLAVDPGNMLWKSDTDACCDLRKVRPLDPALEGFDAWITGRKRFHGGARLSLPVVEHVDGRFKVNPLANWSQEDVGAFFADRNLPAHPLVAQGYPSIGCWPCTQPSADPGDIRSGRWAGQMKEECGLHVKRNERPRVF
ncbi:phosphoadenylyl-sulfate reductase [bacterium]|nr:phosphoadenylyl-sulfate reductase [bacterium]